VTNPAFLEGDILMLLAGKNVSTVEQLYETLIFLHPGQTVQAEVYRNGQKTIVELTILEETV
jgi:S1-C subfamily serine protease